MDPWFPSAQFEMPYHVGGPPSTYALACMRHMHQYGTTHEQLAEIAVATRKWAMLNPKALMRDPLTIDDVLSSRWITYPFHLLDCCIISDGGGAVIVTSLERAKDLRRSPVVVSGTGEAVAHREVGAPDLMTIAAKQSGDHAFSMAKMSPGDIDFCTIYDSFTITVLATLENLGFCKPGEGGPFVEAGRIELTGELPVNTAGGLISEAHVSGANHVVEAVRQLRREVGLLNTHNQKLSVPVFEVAHNVFVI